MKNVLLKVDNELIKLENERSSNRTNKQTSRR